MKEKPYTVKKALKDIVTDVFYIAALIAAMMVIGSVIPVAAYVLSGGVL